MIDYDLPERPLNPPEQETPPCCPWCGAECDTLYRIPTGEIVGCEYCVDTLDAWEYRHLAAEKEDTSYDSTENV